MFVIFKEFILEKKSHLISAVIITKNGERTIKNCIKAAKKAADEIIVVDAFSTDNTVNICKSLEATVHQLQWNGYGAQKNLGNALASHNFILSLDDDEELTDQAIACINQLKLKGLEGIYRLHRKNNYFGRFTRHGLGNPECVTRLFDKRLAKWNNTIVHEKLIIPIGEKVTLINGSINHFSYFSIEQYINKANLYTNLSSKNLFLKRKKYNILKLVYSPLFVFFKSYILKRGFMDGSLGFGVAVLHSYTDFLKYAKLRELYKNERKL